jgi:hypothetical protein
LNGPGAHRRAGEVLSRRLYLFLGDHGGIGNPQHGQEGSQGLIQHDLQSIAIKRLQTLHMGRVPLHERRGSLDMLQNLGHRHGPIETEETGQGVDHILRRHLPPMMKPNPSAQGEGPGASIPGRFPKLGQGGQGLEVGIKLDQAVEELADHGAAITIGHQGGIQCGGIVAQLPAVRPPKRRARPL